MASVPIADPIRELVTVQCVRLTVVTGRGTSDDPVREVVTYWHEDKCIARFDPAEVRLGKAPEPDHA